MILELSPDASLLARATAATVLYLHIAGGGIGLVSGFAALGLRKGSRAHRIAGHVFFVSMLFMSGIGAAVSPLLGKPLDSLAGCFTFYLVTTAWMTMRRRDGLVGSFERVAFVAAAGMIAVALGFALRAANAPSGDVGGYAPEGYLVLAAFVALPAAMDLRLLRRGRMNPTQRLVRHLSRMCSALFIAAASFFLGQQQVMPAYLHGSPLLFAPEIIVLGSLLFWLVRVKLPRRPRTPAMATA